MEEQNKHTQERTLLYRAGGLGIAIILFALGIYLLRFGKLKISDRPKDWADFSNYINPFFALSGLPILAALSYMVYRAGIRKDEQELKYREISERPIIIFRVEPGKGRWRIMNLGKGAAMNIIVAYSNDGESWLYPVKCYSLEPNGFLTITWHSPVYAWRAVYNDVFEDNYYTATCIGDETKIKKGNGLEGRTDLVRLDETVWLGPQQPNAW
jgi:hypothetical protein